MTRILAMAALFQIAIVCVHSRQVRREIDGVEETPLKLEQDNFVVREGHKLMISCVFQSHEISDMSDLKWLTATNNSIDGDSSSSVFTIGLHEHGTQYMKKTLHFTEINQRDAGDYYCHARDNEGKTFRKKVHISVLEPILWRSREARVGGLVGEPVTVDCAAVGKPQPAIQISNEDGEPLDDQLYRIAGEEVTVSYLSKEYNGAVVECMALQVLPELATTSTEERRVTIDVWYPPEFESQKIHRHIVLGNTAILPCNVTSSNPPARHFNFFRNNVLLTNQDKYEHVMDTPENSAHLKVKDVEAGDLGDYLCEVNNGKAKSTQIINLRQANPPDEVKVTLEDIKKHVLTWSVEPDEDDELPAKKIEIQYIRKELLDKEVHNDLDREEVESVWATLASKSLRNIDPSNQYVIGGLRPNTEYDFRFRAQSEAGFGPFLLLSVTTTEEVKQEEETAAPDAAAGLGCFASLTVVVVALSGQILRP